MRSQNAQLGQSEAVALGNAAQQNQQATFGQQATVAGLMQPQFYNQSSTNTSSGTSTSTGENASKFTGGDLLGAGLSAGSNLLSMF